ncbi:unnamed protein product [Mesocestoides corti]|nr:unnamed protein product [Mesocestoides corti]
MPCRARQLDYHPAPPGVNTWPLSSAVTPSIPPPSSHLDHPRPSGVPRSGTRDAHTRRVKGLILGLIGQCS